MTTGVDLRQLETITEGRQGKISKDRRRLGMIGMICVDWVRSGSSRMTEKNQRGKDKGQVSKISNNIGRLETTRDDF